MATPVEGTPEINYEPNDVQGVVPDQNNTPGPNPAWNDVLGIIPEQFHPVITPHFQKWDQAAQSRIESLNTQFEPYKAFVEHGIDADTIQQSLRLMQAIENDPRAVYDALNEAYKYNQQQADPDDDSTEDAESGGAPQIQLPPGYDQIQQSVQILAQQELQRVQAAQAEAEDKQLVSDIEAAQKKLNFGPEQGFVEAQVLPYIAQALDAGKSVEAGMQAFLDMRNAILQSAPPKPFAPSLLGNNSGQGVGLPSQATDVTKLSNNDTRKLVAEYAKRMAAGG